MGWRSGQSYSQDLRDQALRLVMPADLVVDLLKRAGGLEHVLRIVGRIDTGRLPAADEQ